VARDARRCAAERRYRVVYARRQQSDERGEFEHCDGVTLGGADATLFLRVSMPSMRCLSRCLRYFDAHATRA